MMSDTRQSVGPRRKLVPVTIPRLSAEKSAQAVAELARRLGISERVFSGPLAKGRLSTDSIFHYRWERLQIDFLKKYPGFAWGNPREQAVRSFHQSEEECRQTNLRIRHLSDRAEPEHLMPYIHRAQELIGGWLGDFDWGSLLSRGRWGPGVTSASKGTRLHAAVKFGQPRPEVTPAFARTGMQLIAALPSWSNLIVGLDFPTWVTPLPVIVTGNRVTFVPKTSVTDRGIAVEPHVNIFFQLGMGTLLREKLKRAGLDLNTQEVNQKLACLGSLDDSLSTLDLERASDTLAMRVVHELFPPKWVEALDRLRSHFGELDGSWYPYHKFSSMGNGFTFELESMIFYALSLSVAQLDGYNSFWCQAFGDDIVVPSGCYENLCELLAFLGFTVNHEKSFHSGPFRESCGKDYIRGSLVRPVYLKEVPDNPLAWIKIANNLKRLAHTWNEFDGLDSRLKPAYEFSLSLIPRFFRRFSVSDGYGDVALIRDLDHARPQSAGNGWEGWTTSVILPRPVTFKVMDRSLVTAAVSNPGSTGNDLPLRSEVEHAIGPMHVPQWRDMGSWR